MTTFFIFEQHSQSTLRFNSLRSVNGYEACRTVDANTKTEALEKWLNDNSDSYDLFLNEEDGSHFEGASERVVFEKGDTSADFADFMVKIYTLEEVMNDETLLKVAKRSPNMESFIEAEDQVID